MEVVDVKKTTCRGLILHLKQRNDRQKATNFKVGEGVGLNDPRDDKFFGGIIKEGVKKYFIMLPIIFCKRTIGKNIFLQLPKEGFP